MTPGSPLVLIIAEDPPLPTFSLRSAADDITEGQIAAIVITLSEELEEDVTLNLVASTNSVADYGTSADWNLSVDGADCASASGMNCQVTISAGDGSTEARIFFEANTDSDADSGESAIVSVEVDSGSASFVQAGSQSSFTFTVEDQLPTVSLNYSGSATINVGESARMSIRLSEGISDPVTLNIVGGGTAIYGAAGDYEVQYRSLTAGMMPPMFFAGTVCTSASGSVCQVTLDPGETIVDLLVETYGPSVDIALSVELPSASASLVELGDPSSVTITTR